MDSDRSVSPQIAMIIIAAIIGAALLVGLLAGDDSADGTGPDDITEDDPTVDDPTPLDDPALPDEPEARPDVPPITCQGLITQSETDDALGTWDRSPIPGSLDLQQGETCIERFAEEPEFFVSIGPGELADFLPGARVGGVAGEPVAAVGDGAIWFDGESGTLSVFEETPLGGLAYRVGIGRPDVDSATRLQIARTLAINALPRFPGVQLEPVEPTEISFDIEPADLAGLSYVDNLRAKEEDGEWSHGEGLVATLELLLGSRAPADVLREPALGDRSGSGVIRLAQNYVEDGPDEEMRESLIELLDELVLSEDELAALIATSTPREGEGDENIAAAASPAGRTVSLLYSPTPAQDSGCVQNCTIYIEITDKFDLIAPEPGTQGWTEDDINAAIAAVVQAAEIYEQLGDLPNITIVFTTAPGEAFTDMSLSDFHTMYLNTDLQELGIEQFEQSVAGQMALSLLATEFNAGDGAAQQWWSEGMAVYLSGVAFPHGNREQEYLPDLLAAMESGTPLMQRGPATWLFFEYLHSQIGEEAGVLDLIRSLPPLEDYPGIADHWHTFNQLLADGAVFDLDGQGVAFGAKHSEWVIVGPHRLTQTLGPFSVFRMFLASPEEDACVKLEASGATVSMRFAGEAGPLGTDSGPPGTWGRVPKGMIGDLNYEVVVTTGSAGGTFTFETVDKEDAEECSPAVFNDPDPDDSAEECSLDDLCAPSDYFHDLIPEVFEAMSEALKQSQNKEP